MSVTVRKFDWLGGFFIPLAYLIVVLFLDAVTSRSTITPLFGIIGLLVFSFCLTPGVMTFWSSLYSLVVMVIFLNPFLFHLLNSEATSGDDLTPLVRSATFVVGAMVATLFCRVQWRLKQSNSALAQMLQKIPVPVITADQDGRIHFANRAAADIAGLPQEELSGRSFFDLFADKDRQGSTIADYLRRFSSPKVEHSMPLRCGGRFYLGSTQLMDVVVPRLLMVVFTEDDSTPSRT